VASGIQGSLPELTRQIRRCIGSGDGRVLDAASEKLAATREQRRQNLFGLRAAIEEWARKLHRQGAADRSQVGFLVLG
jgi:hypothetical protein